MKVMTDEERELLNQANLRAEESYSAVLKALVSASKRLGRDHAFLEEAGAIVLQLNETRRSLQELLKGY